MCNMAPIKRLCLFFLGLSVITEYAALARVEYLDTVSWSGVSFYIPVDKKALQDKLDHFHADASVPQLYVPENPVFPKLPENTHPLYIDFGNVTFQDVIESENGWPEEFTSHNVELTVNIPFLSLSPSGPLEASINIAIFHDPSDDVFPEYAMVPYTDVDSIEMNGKYLLVKNGNDEIRITYAMPRPCNRQDPDIAADFEGYLNEETIFSPVVPTFDFCEKIPEDRYCKKVETFKNEMLEVFPNVCERWKSEDGRSCEASVDVVKITEGFWDEIPVTQAEGIKVFEAEGYIGHFDMAIKYPCME